MKGRTVMPNTIACSPAPLVKRANHLFIHATPVCLVFIEHVHCLDQPNFLFFKETQVLL